MSETETETVQVTVTYEKEDATTVYRYAPVPSCNFTTAKAPNFADDDDFGPSWPRGWRLPPRVTMTLDTGDDDNGHWLVVTRTPKPLTMPLLGEFTD